MLTLTGLDELKSHVGKELGVSEWLAVTQETNNRFAEVTGDDQWWRRFVQFNAAYSTSGDPLRHGSSGASRSRARPHESSFGRGCCTVPSVVKQARTA
jgi:hypothetical protein